MLVNFNQEKFNYFLQVISDQDFIQFKGMTSKYRAFEDPNLPDDIKMSLLNKLSVTNHLDITNFETFWNWMKTKHGTALSIMLSHFLFPEDEKYAIKVKNQMRNDSAHPYWTHIKARIYKKWCSIITEMQCVYAVAEGVKNKNLPWEVIASPELDAIGIDFAVVIKDEDGEKKFYPIQIKKDTYNVYANQKHNSKENFDTVIVKKKALGIINDEIKKLKITATIAPLTILKYGLSKGNQLPYNYLKIKENGFVYYDSDLLVDELSKYLVEENTELTQ